MKNKIILILAIALSTPIFSMEHSSTNKKLEQFNISALDIELALEIFKQKIKSKIDKSKDLDDAISRSIKCIKKFRSLQQKYAQSKNLFLLKFEEAMLESKIFNELKKKATDEKNKEFFNLQRTCLNFPLDFILHKLNFLIKAGADVNAKDKYGETPLLRTISHQTQYAFYIAKLLIENGANINVKSDTGLNYTPLMMAVFWCNAPAAKLLLDNNADISIMDDEGKTALDMAISSYDPVIEQLIEEKINNK